MSKPSSRRYPVSSRCGDSRAGVVIERAKLVENLAGSSVREEQRPSGRIGSERRDHRGKFTGRSGGHRRRAAHHAEQLGRRHPGPVTGMGEQIAERDHCRAGEAHMLIDHLHVVLAAPSQVRDELVVAERGGINALEFLMDPNRRRLEAFVPLTELFAPELLRPDLLGAGKPYRDLIGAHRLHGVIGEAVDVRVLHVDQHPVVSRELAESTLQRRRVNLGPITRRGAGEMNGLDRPRTSAWRFKLKFGNSI